MECTLNVLEETSSMTNVTIVCTDGIIQTHKIVVASASDFIKQLFNDVPVGDEITLYLPDHERVGVVDLLNGIFPHKKQGIYTNLDDFLGSQSHFQPEMMKVRT